MNHLISYSESTHPYFFLTCFIEGLRPDIRAVVLVQRQRDLDPMCSLALLPEEVADGDLAYERFSHANRGQGQASRTASPSFFVRPATPTANSEDRRGTDDARATPEASKVAALRAGRRAKGLCLKCGERWGKDHVCPPTVQMHIVDELFAMFSLDDAASELPPDSPISTKKICPPFPIRLKMVRLPLVFYNYRPGCKGMKCCSRSIPVVPPPSWTVHSPPSSRVLLCCRALAVCALQTAPPFHALAIFLTVLGLRKNMSSRLISKFSSWVRMTLYWKWIGYANTTL